MYRGRRAEVCRDGLRSPFAAETRGFNLDAESLVFHGASSLVPGGFSRPRRRLRGGDPRLFRPATHSSLCAAEIATR